MTAVSRRDQWPLPCVPYVTSDRRVRQLVLASAILPLAGFLGGGLASWATGRSLEDAVAISIETGVQNTGVAIFMLKFSLPEPSSDLSIGEAPLCGEVVWHGRGTLSFPNDGKDLLPCCDDNY